MVEDIRSDVHQPSVLEFELVVSLDIFWKSLINLFDDSEKNMILRCWLQCFICRLCYSFIPVDDFIPPGAVIDNSSSVSMIEPHWGHGSSVVLDIDDVEKVDTFSLYVVVLSDPRVDPLQGGGVTHDCGVMLGGDTAGDLTEKHPQLSLPLLK